MSIEQPALKFGIKNMHVFPIGQVKCQNWIFWVIWNPRGIANLQRCSQQPGVLWKTIKEGSWEKLERIHSIFQHKFVLSYIPNPRGWNLMSQNNATESQVLKTSHAPMISVFGQWWRAIHSQWFSDSWAQVVPITLPTSDQAEEKEMLKRQVKNERTICIPWFWLAP